MLPKPVVATWTPEVRSLVVKGTPVVIAPVVKGTSQLIELNSQGASPKKHPQLTVFDLV